MIKDSIVNQALLALMVTYSALLTIEGWAAEKSEYSVELSIIAAAQTKDYPLMEQLIGLGDDLIVSRRRSIALYVSVCVDNVEGIELLLNKGAFVNLVKLGNSLKSPLHQAISVTRSFGAVELLCQYGADVNQVGDRGWTPLMYASYNNDEPLVKLLLNSGADPFYKNIHGRAALELTGNDDIKQLIQNRITEIDNERTATKEGLVSWSSESECFIPDDIINIITNFMYGENTQSTGVAEDDGHDSASFKKTCCVMM